MAMNLKRRMVAPYQFGTASGYAFADEFDEGSEQGYGFNDVGYGAALPPPSEHQGPVAFDDTAIAPHADHVKLYAYDKSWRIWEPMREAMAADSAGPDAPAPIMGDGTQSDESPNIVDPKGCYIRGIKGELNFRFSDFGFVQNQTDSIPGSTYHGEWVNELGEQAFGFPTPEVNLAAPTTWWEPFLWGRYTNETQPIPGSLDYTRLHMAKVPVFVTMYVGTLQRGQNLNSLGDAEAGWIIDSGPADDPVTQLATDITSPEFLESKRVVWWDVFHATLPVPVPDASNPSALPQLGGTVKYNLNLDRNFLVKKNQVLWLHISTGIVRVPIMHQTIGPAPNNLVVITAMYQGHPFSAQLTASLVR